MVNRWWSKYIGIPFKELGRDKEGVDCWGLIKIVYREELGIELPSFVYEDVHDSKIVRVYESTIHNWEAGEGDEFQVGLFRTDPFHVGLYIDKKYMLHTMEGYSVVLQMHNTALWRKKLLNWYVYKGQ